MAKIERTITCGNNDIIEIEGYPHIHGGLYFRTTNYWTGVETFVVLDAPQRNVLREVLATFNDEPEPAPTPKIGDFVEVVSYGVGYDGLVLLVTDVRVPGVDNIDKWKHVLYGDIVQGNDNYSSGMLAFPVVDVKIVPKPKPLVFKDYKVGDVVKSTAQSGDIPAGTRGVVMRHDANEWCPLEVQFPVAPFAGSPGRLRRYDEVEPA